MKRLLLALLLMSCAAAAQAGFSSNALDRIAADPQPNAQLPLDARFTDEHGAPLKLGDALQNRPAVLIFADYTCRTLCGPILAFAAGALEKSGLRPGHDYSLIVVGIDANDPLSAAAAFKSARIGADSPLASATIVLSGRQDAIDATTQAAGYRFSYDAEHDQFAHPAAAYVLTPQGRIARVLSGLGLDAGDLRLALVEASQGKIGTFADRIHLLCYGFDPTVGIYTPSIMRWLAAGAALTLAAIFLGVGALVLQRRRTAA